MQLKIKSLITLFSVITLPLLLIGCVGCPRTDRYYSAANELQTDSLSLNLSIFSAIRYKEVRYTVRVNSASQKPDSIILATKYRKYNLQVKDSVIKDTYTEYLYIKEIPIGDINWYARSNAQEISLKSYKNNNPADIVYYRTEK